MGNEAKGNDAYRVWQSHWGEYIEKSKRASSSATITAKKFIELARISEGARILDLGCGHGRITELLARNVPGLDIVAVDMTQQLLDKFLLKPGVNGCRLRLLCGDITKLSLGDNDFDAVVSSRVFQYLPDPVAGLREAHRVVKPEGYVAISVPNRLNLVKFLTYRRAPLYSSFQVREWYNSCRFENIEYGSMCFFPPTHTLSGVAMIVEGCAKVPAIRYCGGNVLVSGRKRK